MFDNRRSRARRASFTPSEPPTQPSQGEYHARDFSIPLNGYGQVVLVEYTTELDQYARIDFTCEVSGTLQVQLGRQVVLKAKVAPGKATVTGLFLPGGLRVMVLFANDGKGSSVSGSVHIGPAPVTDALVAARTLFGLPEKFSTDQLARAHRKLVLRWHPDRAGGDTAKMAEINHFHDLLKASLAR